jgi:hypothetical protein
MEDEHASLAQVEGSPLPKIEQYKAKRAGRGALHPCPGQKILLTFHAEIMMEGSHSSVGIDCDMEVLVHKKIIAGTLNDNPEIVHQGLFEIYYTVETMARLSCSRILELVLHGICWGLAVTKPLFLQGQSARIVRYPLHVSVILSISLVTSPFGVIVM